MLRVVYYRTGCPALALVDRPGVAKDLALVDRLPR
jgi:hypothetical protein